MKFDDAFGIHEQALKLRARRSEVLASNLANAETPGYKAKDLDFRQILNQQKIQSSPSTVRIASTHKGHIRTASPAGMGELKYRNPQQASLDGNSVEVATEQTAFSENALRYQASLRFLDGRIKGLLTAIKGQ